MNILLSNDDGWNAVGITMLFNHLKPFFDVTIVAPRNQKSATGHSISLNKPLHVKKMAENIYSVDGTPTDSVKVGIHDLYKDKKPDLILSGINHGGNIGDDITYSGTVAVAIEGCLNDIPSIATSLVTSNTGEKEELHFEDAAKIVTTFIKRFEQKKTPIPHATFLNMNIPNCPRSEMKGIKFTSLGKRCYEENLLKVTDPFGHSIVWFKGSEFTLVDKDGTDADAILNRYVSVTPLQLDFSNYDYLETLRNEFKILSL